MDIKELRKHSIVKYKDKLCFIENINGIENTVYILHSDKYYCTVNIEEILPVEIEKDVILNAGYYEVFPGIYKLQNSDLTIEEMDDHFIVKVPNICECKVKYWHELQMIQGLYEDKEY